MTTYLTIPCGMWIQIPGTEWEVYQDSGEVAFLGDGDIPVRIRRAAKQPTIWGPRPPVESRSRNDWAESYDRVARGFRNP